MKFEDGDRDILIIAIHNEIDRLQKRIDVLHDKVIVTREYIRAYWGGEFTVTDPEDGEFIRITNAEGRTGQFFPSSLSKVPPVFKFTKGDKVYIKRPNVTKEDSWGGLLTVAQDYKSGDRYVYVQRIFNGTTDGFVGGFYPETVFHVEDMPESLQEAPSPLKPVVKRPKETLKLVFNAPERIISYLEAHPGSKKRELKKNQSRNYRLGGFETDFAKLLTDKRIYIAADGQIRVPVTVDIALGTRVRVNLKYPYASSPLHGMLGTVTERRQKGLYVFVNLDGVSYASLFLPDELDVVTVNQTDGII